MTAEHDEKTSDTTQVHSTQGTSFVKGLERRPVLTSLRGELLATPIPLERDVVTIGRALDADIRLNDFKASRLHELVFFFRLFASLRHPPSRTFVAIEESIAQSMSSQTNLITP